MFCKIQGIERVAEQLLASQEGLFSVTFIFNPLMILTVKMEGIFRAATVLSVLVIVYTIPCHDRSH